MFEVKEIGNCNLVMCEIIKIHISESVLGANNLIDQQKIDLVARMGGNWYCRAHGDALFEIEKPITTIGVGVDSIPNEILILLESRAFMCSACLPLPVDRSMFVQIITDPSNLKS